MIVLNVALILIVAAGLYVRSGGGGERGRRYLAGLSALFGRPADENAEASAAPAPVAAPPVVVKDPVATQAPAVLPAAASTPAPPKPFAIADLAANPGAWPKSLRLKQSVTFPAVYNSQVVGSAAVPAGTAVNLQNIQGDQLVLEYQGGTQKVPWKLTDLEETVGSAPVAPAATPAPETSAGATQTAPAGN